MILLKTLHWLLTINDLELTKPTRQDFVCYIPNLPDMTSTLTTHTLVRLIVFSETNIIA